MGSAGIVRACVSFFLSIAVTGSPSFAKWKYFRTGNSRDSSARPRGGFALMGGGAKQEPAFRFLCERTNGGDFLILRAHTDDDYAQQVNKEVQAVCPLNSVATIVFDDREEGVRVDVAGRGKRARHVLL